MLWETMNQIGVAPQTSDSDIKHINRKGTIVHRTIPAYVWDYNVTIIHIANLASHGELFDSYFIIVIVSCGVSKTIN